MSTLYYFVQSIPESAGIIALSLGLARIPLRLKEILIGGVFISILTFGIRSLPITFGFHLPINIFLIFLAITRLTNIKPSRAIVAVFTAFFTLALLEYGVSGSFFAFTHMDPNKVVEDAPLWTILGIVQDVFLLIIAAVVPHLLKPTEGAWKK